MAADEREARVTVIEATNEELHESYFFLSSAALEDVMRRQCVQPPARIAHWKRGQGIRYREIESGIDRGGASAFLRTYAEFVGRSGWKVLVE